MESGLIKEVAYGGKGELSHLELREIWQVGLYKGELWYSLIWDSSS